MSVFKVNQQNPFPNLNPTKIVNQIFTANKAGTQNCIVAFVLDESSSMGSLKNETITGFNNFLELQKKNEDKTFVVLNKFNGGSVKTVYDTVPLESVTGLNTSNYTPGGYTNLLDAIGSTINLINSKLSEVNSPSVVIVILTDGEENSSREFNNEQIKAMVKECEAKNWAFTFLGASLDAFQQGATFGMSALNTVVYNTANMADAMETASAGVTSTRTSLRMGSSVSESYNTMYSASDRNKAVGKK